MSNQETEKNLSIQIYLCLLTLAGLAVIIVSVLNFTKENLDAGFLALSLIIIFFSSHLRIKIPRSKIHLSFSEILVFYALLVYGAGAAVLIAGVETLYSSVNLRRKGTLIRNKTILFNTAISIVATYLTALTVNLLFSSKSGILREESLTEFIGMLICIGVGQFLYNSVGVSLWETIKTGKSFEKFWEFWFEYCTSALVIFIAAAVTAGLIIKGQAVLDTTLFLLAMGVSSIVFFTYRRYVNDVEKTSAQAEQSERERAEQAERHIKELQHHITEQDRIGQALRESKERFRHAAFHDALTDLPNRNLFMETLKFALEKTKQKSDFKFAVLFLDINRFKTINDSFGHSMGDRLILQVAKRLATSVREKDMVARFGGDEFAFVLNKISDVNDAIKFAERIKEKISAPFSLSGRQVFTSFSIGIALGSSQYEAAEDVLRDADIAMYNAKESGKDWVVFDQKMHTRALTLLQLETDLRSALERSELCMYYQPIISLDSMKLGGFEALVRWNHPQRGLVPPNEFIPVSEDTELNCADDALDFAKFLSTNG